MEKSEAEAIGEALCRWLDGQGVSPSDGVQAMATAIGRMLGTKAQGSVSIIEGLHMTYQLIHVTAVEVLEHHGKLGRIA